MHWLKYVLSGLLLFDILSLTFEGKINHKTGALANSEVSKGAKIRNRYNQVSSQLTQDINGKMTNSQLDTKSTHKKQPVTSQHKQWTTLTLLLQTFSKNIGIKMAIMAYLLYTHFYLCSDVSLAEYLCPCIRTNHTLLHQTVYHTRHIKLFS